MTVEDKAGKDLITAMKTIVKTLHQAEKDHDDHVLTECTLDLGTVSRALIDDIYNSLDSTDEMIIKLATIQNKGNSNSDPNYTLKDMKVSALKAMLQAIERNL